MPKSKTLTSEQMFQLRRRGFFSDGNADPSLVKKTTRQVREKRRYNVEQDGATKVPDQDLWEREELVVYSQLAALAFANNAPKILVRMLGHMDVADVKNMRQTCRAIRFALDTGLGRDLVSQRFLGEVGFKRWRSRGAQSPPTVPEPITLSFADIEGFIVSHDLLGEYQQVAREAVQNPRGFDPRFARLARGTTRGYNRVLARLRAQPNFVYPAKTNSNVLSPPIGRSPAARQGAWTSPQLPSPVNGLSPAVGGMPARVNSYYDGSPASPATGAVSPLAMSPVDSPNPSFFATPTPTLPCPWRPGRAAQWRVWVPAQEAHSGWLTDEELTTCEQELFKAGVWKLLKRGDTVWDCALGNQRNQGKYIFDGNFLR